MTKRLVDIDDELLHRATEILEAGTMKDAVNTALAEVIAADRRRRHVLRLQSMAGLDLEDSDVMARAWD